MALTASMNNSLKLKIRNNPTEFYLKMGNSPQVPQNGISIFSEHTGFEGVVKRDFVFGQLCYGIESDLELGSFYYVNTALTSISDRTNISITVCVNNLHVNLST